MGIPYQYGVIFVKSFGFVGSGATCMAIILVLAALVPSATLAGYDYHQESFLGYLNVGPAFPGGSGSGDYKTGLHAGGGFGLVVARGKTVSLEAGIRGSFYHFPLENPRAGQFVIESEEFGSVSLEGRLRFSGRHRLRPFVSFATGMYNWDKLTSVGAGFDVAVTSRGDRPFYVEIKYLQAETDQIRIDLGLRIG